MCVYVSVCLNVGVYIVHVYIYLFSRRDQFGGIVDVRP